MSPRKMRVVANIVRNKKVEEAVGLLDLMPKKAAAIGMTTGARLPTPRPAM